jgi:adenine deaminase
MDKLAERIAQEGLRRELVAAARCEVEVDLMLEGAELANVISGEIYRSDLAIHKGKVVGTECLSAKRTIDLGGAVLAPGFIDSHVHIESSMVPPPEYARAVVPKGTTAAVIDPHEMANVMGSDGIRYLLDSSIGIPMDIFVMLPSCVPATDLETSGATMGDEELASLIDLDRVLGIGEMMNYPGVILRDPLVYRKIAVAGRKRIDGHAPLLSGRDLAAYIAAGIRSDHECTSLKEAKEKLRLGMYIMIREGSAAKNMLDLLPLVSPNNCRNMLFVSDDRHPSDILREGHIDFMVRTAIMHGLSPISALQIASINAAMYFGLPERGALAPGYLADIVVLDDLESFSVKMVFKEGQLVAESGRMLQDPQKDEARAPSDSVKIGRIDLASFSIPASSELARVIEVVPDQIITKARICPVKISDGIAVSDTDRDILKMAVIERHHATGHIGCGFVSGFGLKEGAISTTVAHDSHNIAVVGTASRDMLAAVLAIKQMGGGMAAVSKGKVKAELPLPIGGLLSDRPMHEVASEIDEIVYAAHDLGSELKDPFMTLSFLCLPVIPELKLTDKGLVDVSKFKHVPLFVRSVEETGSASHLS